MVELSGQTGLSAGHWSWSSSSSPPTHWPWHLIEWPPVNTSKHQVHIHYQGKQDLIREQKIVMNSHMRAAASIALYSNISSCPFMEQEIQEKNIFLLLFLASQKKAFSQLLWAGFINLLLICVCCISVFACSLVLCCRLCTLGLWAGCFPGCHSARWVAMWLQILWPSETCGRPRPRRADTSKAPLISAGF